jgi:hypothetical protein
MRVLSSRGATFVAFLAPLLAACGVALEIADDPSAVAARLDGGGPDGDASGGEGGVIDVDANVLIGDDAGADGPGADACATVAVCAPERLVTLAGGVLRLVVSGTSLYAAHASAAEAHFVRVATSGPAPALDLDPYATGPDAFRPESNIAVDATGAVYWGTPNGLRRHETGVGADASTGAGVTELSSLGAPVSGVRIAADGRLHYAVSGPNVAAPNGGHLGSCALPGCTDVQVSTYTPLPYDVIAIGATNWWLGTDASFANLALRNGVFVGPTQSSPSPMVADGAGHIFWSTFFNLEMFTIAGNVLVDLLAADTAAATRVNGITLDPAGTLYVTRESNVLRCAIVGNKCSFTTIATTPGIATSVAADATHLYWGTSDGSVWRQRKP